VWGDEFVLLAEVAEPADAGDARRESIGSYTRALSACGRECAFDKHWYCDFPGNGFDRLTC